MYFISKKLISSFVVILILSSQFVHASLNSEQKKHHKLEKKWVYKAYRKISKESVRGITQAYNFQFDEHADNKISRAQIHALLGYMWSLGLDANFAIAESHLALNKASRLKDKYIAKSALVLAFYNKGWTELAREHALKLSKNPEYTDFADKYKKEQLVANLIIGSLAIRQGNVKVTQDAFAKIAVETDKPWITTLAKTAAFSMSGSVFEAAGQIKELLKDPTLTAYERKKITEIQQSNEQVEMLSKIDNLLFDSIKNQSKTGYQKLIGDLENYMDDVKL